MSYDIQTLDDAISYLTDVRETLDERIDGDKFGGCCYHTDRDIDQVLALVLEAQGKIERRPLWKRCLIFILNLRGQS